MTCTSNYTVVGYAHQNTYSVKPTVWIKTACCGAKRFGQQCSDCPN